MSEKSHGAREVTPLQAAAAVARLAELSDVRTSKVSAQLCVELEEILDRTCTIRTESGGGYTFAESTNRLTVQIPASVTIFESADEPDSPEQVGRALVKIEAIFVLTYEIGAAPPTQERDRYFGAFAALNGTYNAWPYLRELVQSMLTRLGLPGLALPVFRLPRSDEEAPEEKAPPKLRVVGGGSSS